MLPEIRSTSVCVRMATACVYVWEVHPFNFPHTEKVFLRFPHSQITCVFLKSTQESGGLTCQQFTITVPSAERFINSSPWMNHKWITVFKDKEITGTHHFMEKGSTVPCQLQKGLICSCFFCVKWSLRTRPPDNETYGYMAQWPPWAHTWKTHKPTYVTLPMAFCVTMRIIHCYKAEGIYHYTQCCFKVQLFMRSLIQKDIYVYIYIYKQKLVCRQWISSLCDSTGLGPGCFCVLPMLTLAWEKLKLL